MDRFPGDDLFSSAARRRGLPFVKERLGAEGYVRYLDDFLVFADEKAWLARAREKLGEFLAGLRLRLHPRKNVVFPVSEGIPFLGYRVFPTRRHLKKEDVKRFRRRLARMRREYAEGKVELPKFRQRIAAWIGHAKEAITYSLRRRILAGATFRRAAASR